MDIPLFGSKRDFWAKYDAFSFTFDKDMMERLNTNLDVMLIFAGLFSAINTAFIVVALTALSANPADETNHLLRLLVLTLCCSLLTAGAVLAKQWLQLYERAGQTGPIDQQALRRTEKFAGAEKWGLHPVVETLATLLLVSLALFFIALTDYLWTVEKKVALVALAFAVSGAFLYIVMVVAAAILPACPFQTGPSRALRQLGIMGLQLIRASPDIPYWYMRHILQPHLAVLNWLLAKLNSSHSVVQWIAAFALFSYFLTSYLILAIIFRVIMCCARFLGYVLLLQQEPSQSNWQSLQALSAVLIAESSPHPDNLLTVADNIPLIFGFDAVRLISSSSSAFQSLLSQLHKTLQSVRSSDDHTKLTDAVTLARAVAHVVLATQNALHAPQRCSSITWATSKRIHHLDGSHQWK
ncbi:hypothetical protein FRB96_009650 [Tulasnella sp. 330]|nr:hypothetical protein FRB96_009650 [Tulasnella sp. 330]